MFASEIAVRALGLVSMLIVARVLGPTALGQLAIAQAVVAYASVVGDAGLTTLTQRSMVREPIRAERLVATTTSIQLTLSALLVVAVLGASAVLGPIVAGFLISANVEGLTWRPIFLINIVLAPPGSPPRCGCCPRTGRPAPSPSTAWARACWAPACSP